VHPRPRSAASFAVLLLLAACGASHTQATVTRRLAGRTTPGVFVSPGAYEHFVRAEYAASLARWAEAAAAYRYALAFGDEDPLLHARLAIALDQVGQRDDADEALARALALDPDAEAAHLARGEIALARGDVRAAIAAFERARASAPESEGAALRLAAVLRDAGALQRADAVLDRLAREGGPAGATAARARFAAALAGSDVEATADAALTLLRIAPARAADVREAATRALDAGRADLAARLVAAMPARDSDLPLRVRVALATGDLDATEGLLAITDPDALGGEVETARLWLGAGRTERALELAREAVRRQPGPAAQRLLGDAALAAGHPDEAAEAYARVRRDAPEWVDACRGLTEALRRAALPGLAADVGGQLQH
jgi:tetratricopeptide (TPR) repeat protein